MVQHKIAIVIFTGLSLTAMMAAHAAPVVEFKPLSAPPTPAPTLAPTVATEPVAVANNDQAAKLWEMYENMQRLDQQVRQLQGKLEEQEALLEQTRRDAKDRYIDLDQRLEQQTTQTPAPIQDPSSAPDTPTENAPDTLPAPVSVSSKDTSAPAAASPGSTETLPPATTSTPTSPAVVSQTTPIPAATVKPIVTPKTAEPKAEAEFQNYDGNDKKAYIAAYEAFKAGGASKAIDPMKSFISKYPKSLYFPNANYWLGEFYLAVTPPRFRDAKAKFTIVKDQFPSSQKAASAIYRLATMAEVDKQNKEATALMQLLVKDYAGSKEAEYASDYLAQQNKK